MAGRYGNGSERLVLVTHREPFRVVQRDDGVHVERTVGGLVTALEPMMRDVGGAWVSADVETNADQDALAAALEKLPYEWLRVPYSADLYERFYQGFSNGALWPLFHSMPSKTVFSHADWVAYKMVNSLFADAAARAARPGDLVWIHDYQLALVPSFLRHRTGNEARIGFLLHIPFPHVSLFRTLPWAEELLRGILGASLVVFHVDEYVEHFFGCVEKLLNVRCDETKRLVHLPERTVHVRSIPIGIDAKQIMDAAARPDVKERAERIRADVGCEKLIVGVDRLDYTKGIYERLRALEIFFERNPEQRGRVSLVQVAVPSRVGIGEYEQLREQIERQVGHINGLYARPGWTPVTYMFRSVPFDELVALYVAGDVGFVSPLRDGMNLVAKEYVAAHAERTGVLVLSELAGAAQQLVEAVRVNPYDVDGMADALRLAVTMPDDQARARMRRLVARVARFDVKYWVDQFMLEAGYVD